MEELGALMHGFAVVLTPMNIALMFVGIILGNHLEPRGRWAWCIQAIVAPPAERLPMSTSVRITPGGGA